jgi:hypothetical protein
VERLMTLLNALDQDVEIVIRAKPRSRAAARIGVVAGRAVSEFREVAKLAEDGLLRCFRLQSMSFISEKDYASTPKRFCCASIPEIPESNGGSEIPLGSSYH